MTVSTTVDAEELRRRVAELLAEHDPATTDRLEFLRARFDAGLAWVHYPVGLGGLDAPRARQPAVDAQFAAAGAPDNSPHRIGIGAVGEGWRVAQTTLMNERVAIGGGAQPREGGMLGVVTRTWRERPELRTPDLHDRLLRLWVEAEVTRLTGARLRQQLAAGQP